MKMGKFSSLFHKIIRKEDGVAPVEYIIISMVMIFMCVAAWKFFASPDFVLWKFFATTPYVVDIALQVATFTAIIGGIAWSGKELIKSSNTRSQVLILEILSDGKPRTRQEIITMLRQESRLFGFAVFHIDALKDLMSENKIYLSDGKYKMVDGAEKPKLHLP